MNHYGHTLTHKNDTMHSNTFTAAERLIFKAQLLDIYRQDSLRPSRDMARQTAEIGEKLLNAGGKSQG